MTHIIKFCPNNFKRQLQDTKIAVKQLPDVQVMENKCLNYCGQCIVEPFAIVNGKGVFCKTADELYPAIQQRLSIPLASAAPVSDQRKMKALY
ncbi:DUF1450 domain-containing protein [Jeotgalibacillus haloalkalitolerans]|uniref:DUF1450 domain-containing protein n=1 Tax=Jeotgalibacillus haloalkalitolerans TaxID=3104292 RepID=A0ABU5KJ14_9BACL|nr:DUF1450 domain-containing protein [Jeotgalibacillus sp. HH7-29]MDZ5710715.1 DUF1450 domain-containing protein [Jeotgalibacillus sp. HH7-29]